MRVPRTQKSMCRFSSLVLCIARHQPLCGWNSPQVHINLASCEYFSCGTYCKVTSHNHLPFTDDWFSAAEVASRVESRRKIYFDMRVTAAGKWQEPGKVNVVCRMGRREILPSLHPERGVCCPAHSEKRTKTMRGFRGRHSDIVRLSRCLVRPIKTGSGPTFVARKLSRARNSTVVLKLTRLLPAPRDVFETG